MRMKKAPGTFFGPTLSRAISLDRDGTMSEDVGYLDRLGRLRLFPYTIEAVGLLNRGGFKVVVVTSQAGIANGFLTEEVLREAHEHLSQRFGSAAVQIVGYYYCLHLPHASVEWYSSVRALLQPQPVLIQASAPDLSLVLAP